MKLYELDSAGAVIDQFGVTYPMQANGQPDWDQGMELTRVDAGEWWGQLSHYDKTTALYVWCVAKKVWWDRTDEITSEAQGCTCTGRTCAPCWMAEPAPEAAVAELRERASDIRIPGPPMLQDMFRFGG
jgi:hypothetical protein